MFASGEVNPKKATTQDPKQVFKLDPCVNPYESMYIAQVIPHMILGEMIFRSNPKT